MGKDNMSDSQRASRSNLARRSATRRANQALRGNADLPKEPQINGIPVSELLRTNPHCFFRPLQVNKPNEGNGNT
jgi:hypothetical protein